MNTSKRMNTFVATAVAIPLAASSLVIPQAKAAEGLNISSEDTINLTVKTSGLPEGTDIKLLNRKGEEISTKQVNSNSALKFTYENDFDNNHFVTLEVDGNKYVPSEGKCFGKNNETEEKIPDPTITSTAASVVDEAQDVSEEDIDSRDDTISNDLSEEDVDASGNESPVLPDGLVDELEKDNNTSEDTAPTEEKEKENNTNGEAETTVATPSDEENTSNSSEKPTVNENEPNNSDSEPSSTETTTQPKLNTDGSNTPVADPMSLVIEKGGKEISTINYVEMKDGSIHVLGEYKEEDVKALNSLYEANPMISLGDAVGEDVEIPEGVQEFIDKLKEIKDTQEYEWFKENADKIQAAVDTIGGATEILSKTYPFAEPVIEAKFPQVYEQIQAAPIEPEEAFNILKTLTSGAKAGLTVQSLLNIVDDLKGTFANITEGIDTEGMLDNILGTGGTGEGGDFGSSNKELTQEELNEKYYSSLEKHQKDEASINESIEELLASMKDGRRMTLDIFDDSYDLKNAISFDMVNCELGFTPVSSTDTGLGEIEVSLDEDESSSDFDANKYFSDITNEKKKPKSTQETTLTASEEPEENISSNPDDTPISEPVPSPTSSVERIAGAAPVVAPASQRPIAPAAVAPVAKKIAGPSVETGGSVDTSFWSKVRNILHI